MMSLNIGLDFDGVICDCSELKTSIAKSVYGVDIPPERFKKELVAASGLLTLGQYAELQRIIYWTREVGFTATPVEGMIEWIPKMQADGHRIQVITSRVGDSLAIAREWTERRGLTLEFTGVGYGVSKANAAAGIDLYVDDDLDKLKPLVDVVPNRFLFSWGHNAHVDATGIAHRIASWNELYRRVNELATVVRAE